MCIFFLFFASLFVSTSAIDCVARLISKMICCVSSVVLNLILVHSLAV